jgi:hypothetical protein
MNSQNVKRGKADLENLSGLQQIGADELAGVEGGIIAILSPAFFSGQLSAVGAVSAANSSALRDWGF